MSSCPAVRLVRSRGKKVLNFTKWTSTCTLTAKRQAQVKCAPKAADPKPKGGPKWRKVQNECASVCMHVCYSRTFAWALHVWVTAWAPGLYWYFEVCDWQGRSLLGEIVNRVEPVICSRQPWKGGSADSQGSYWEFQRCCLTDLGPGPRRTEPASRACFSNPRLINALSHSPSFSSVCFSAALFFSLPLFSHFFNHFKPLFVSNSANFAFSSACDTNCVLASVQHFSIRQKLRLHRTQLNPHN